MKRKVKRFFLSSHRRLSVGCVHVVIIFSAAAAARFYDRKHMFATLFTAISFPSRHFGKALFFFIITCHSIGSSRNAACKRYFCFLKPALFAMSVCDAQFSIVRSRHVAKHIWSARLQKKSSLALIPKRNAGKRVFRNDAMGRARVSRAATTSIHRNF